MQIIICRLQSLIYLDFPHINYYFFITHLSLILASMQVCIPPPSNLVEIEHIIRSKLKVNAWILKDQKFMGLVLQYVYWFNRNANIDQTWFKTVYSLINTFKFPIMFAFKKGYMRVRKMKIMTHYKKNLCQILNLVKRILSKSKSNDSLKFFDLQFFQVHYTIKVASQSPILFEQQELKFIRFIQDLTNLTNHFQRKVNNLCNRKNSKDKTLFTQIKVIQNIFQVLNEEKKKSIQKYNFLEVKNVQKLLIDADKIYLKYAKFAQKNQIKIGDQQAMNFLNKKQMKRNETTSNLMDKLNNNYQAQETRRFQQKNKEKSKIINNCQNQVKQKTISVKKIKVEQPIQVLSDSQELISQKSSQQTFQDWSYKANVPLCCREFFVFYEHLQSESMRIQYKNYKLPFQDFHGQTLLKTICSFLNSQGGTIYLGVQENTQCFKRIVKGMFCNQKTKEEILKYFRVNIQKIYPDVVANKFYEIYFVPVKKQNFHLFEKNAQYIQGRYVIKLVINPGLRKQLYSYTDAKGEPQFYFRTQNQVITVNLKRDIRKLLQIHKQRIQTPRNEPGKIHQGKCLLPERGHPSYKNITKFTSSKLQNCKTFNNSKQSNIVSNKPKERNILQYSYFEQSQQNSTIETIQTSIEDKKKNMLNKIMMKNEMTVSEKRMERGRYSVIGNVNSQRYK